MTDPYNKPIDYQRYEGPVNTLAPSDRQILVEHYINMAAAAYWLKNKARIVSTLTNASYQLLSGSAVTCKAASDEIERLLTDIKHGQ